MRKATKRKIRPVCTNTLEIAAYNASKFTVAELNAQMIPMQRAIDDLARGDWSDEFMWKNLIECLNRIEALLKLNHVPDQGFIAKAQEVYETIHNRNLSTGSTACRAEELAIVREVVAIYAQLLKEATHGQLIRAEANVRANVERIVQTRRNSSEAICRT